MSFVSLPQAIQLLNAGEVVAFPTETVYGLGGRIDSEAAIKKIFAVKMRPFFDPLICHVSSTEQAKLYAREWPEVYDLFAKAFWPGPLTLICKKTNAISPLITSGLDTVGLRWPHHPMAQELIAKVGVPLAAPSANLFGKTSPTMSAHVEREFASQVPVLEGGASQVGLESTVLSAQWENDFWKIEIYRPGGISRTQIANILSKSHVNFKIEVKESSASPGHLPAHYQPTQPVLLLENIQFKDINLNEVCQKLGRPSLKPVFLTLDQESYLAARNLYNDLRTLSNQENALIVVEKNSSQYGEDWEAIWDRLQRAATLKIKN